VTGGTEPEGSPGETGSTPQGVTRYRKKPVVIEAMQLAPLSIDQAEEFVGGDAGNCPEHSGACMVIATLEGAMHASMGDWIVKGVAGEFYPCRDDIFRQTYEPAGSLGDQVTVSREDLRTVLDYARQFDVDDDPAMIRLSAAAGDGL
jgi:hypothetical protein